MKYYNNDGLTPSQRINKSTNIREVAFALGLEHDDNYMCVCPIHRDNDASLKLYPDNHFHCYGCGQHGDCIDLVAKTLNFTKKEAIKWIFENVINDTNLKDRIEREKTARPHETASKWENLSATEYRQKVVTYVRACEYHAFDTYYFKFRGFTKETVRKFHLGYDHLRNEVVVPYNRALNYYQSRCIGKKFFKKLRADKAGKEPIFNVGALLSNKPIVFIVESPFCAISVYQCGGVAVPLCGVQNVGKFLSFFANHYFKGTLVLCLDNDEAGESATLKLKNGTLKEKGLIDLNIKFKTANICDECKDPNELLMKEPQRLEKNIKEIISQIERSSSSGKQHT